MYFVFTFTFLFAIWLVLSGQFDLFHITLGVISSIIVTLLSHDQLFKNRERTIAQRSREIYHGIFYFFWLNYQIILANFHVLYLALHPKGNDVLEPQVVRFKTKLKSEFAKYVLANSITLTPGTVTIKVDGDEFYVHAISKQTAEGVPGDMENRVARIFDRD